MKLCVKRMFFCGFCMFFCGFLLNSIKIYFDLYLLLSCWCCVYCMDYVWFVLFVLFIGYFGCELYSCIVLCCSVYVVFLWLWCVRLFVVGVSPGVVYECFKYVLKCI